MERGVEYQAGSVCCQLLLWILFGCNPDSRTTRITDAHVRVFDAQFCCCALSADLMHVFWRVLSAACRGDVPDMVKISPRHRCQAQIRRCSMIPKSGLLRCGAKSSSCMPRITRLRPGLMRRTILQFRYYRIP